MFMNTTLRAWVPLGKDYDMNLRFVKNYLWKQRDSFSEKLKSWSVFRQKPLAQASSISKFWGGYRQAYCRVEPINLPLPKSMSSPTLCSAWDKWETILLNPGRSNSNDVRTTIISANWIELMDSYGIRVEVFQADDGRITVWTRELHRKDHIHVNV